MGPRATLPRHLPLTYLLSLPNTEEEAGAAVGQKCADDAERNCEVCTVLREQPPLSPLPSTYDWPMIGLRTRCMSQLSGASTTQASVRPALERSACMVEA